MKQIFNLAAYVAAAVIYISISVIDTAARLVECFFNKTLYYIFKFLSRLHLLHTSLEEGIAGSAEKLKDQTRWILYHWEKNSK